MPKLSKDESKKRTVKVEPGKAVSRRAASKVDRQKRQVIYPKPIVEICVGDKSITYDRAKELVGWEAESDDKKRKFGNKFVFKHNDRKIRLLNNENNRPFYASVAASLKQEILRNRWRFNGEAIILGSTGILLNGQHSLVAFIMAVEEWQAHPELFPDLRAEPVLEKIIVCGVSEDDATVNTMDTCKPRSLSDVIFRAHYFKNASASDNKDLSRVTQFAIRQMWSQFGYANAHDVKRTHSEFIAFLDNHPKVLAAVKHIWEEDNKEGRIDKFLARGCSAAALYLMGSSASDAKVYAKTPDESSLDWNNWDRACEFFVELAGGAESMKAVREAIASLINQGSTNKKERWAVLAKAWSSYRSGKPITPASLKLDFVVKDDVRHLVEVPLFGGIDVGEEGLPFTDLSEKEIEESQTKIREKKQKKSKSGRRSKDGWKEGDQAWVHDEYEEPTFVTVMTDPFLRNSDRTMVVQVEGPEDIREVKVSSLSTLQFEKVSLGASEEG